jgi:glycosyltransferase involved in cell wall biosynthesis
MHNVCFITDPLVTTMGAVRPAILLAKEFRRKGNEVTIITTRFDQAVQDELLDEDIVLKDVGPHFSLIPSLPTLDAWGRCLVTQKPVAEINDSDLAVNTSSCIISQARAYYAQGPMTTALDDMFPQMPIHYKYPYKLMGSTLRILERHLVKKFRDLSDIFVANSAFCASMYKKWGISVDKIINPPLDCSLFEPKTSNPTADYVLTHFGTYGKEGKFSTVKAVADAGVPIRVFGDNSQVPEPLKKHRRISFLGRVTDAELADIYSNALYTLFAFEHEPFGYIPVESMACGTPILTFRKQGPSETVVNRKTGWLSNNDQEMVNLAVLLWKEGYGGDIRNECRERALSFDVMKIAEAWENTLTQELFRSHLAEKSETSSWSRASKLARKT